MKNLLIIRMEDDSNEAKILFSEHYKGLGVQKEVVQIFKRNEKMLTDLVNDLVNLNNRAIQEMEEEQQ